MIMVEGILIFENKALRDQMDIKIFVDTDADIRLCRRIKRDVNKRGRSMESVLLQYQATVKPMHDRYVEPSKRFADLVVLEGGKNLVALDMIMNRIQRHIEKNCKKLWACSNILLATSPTFERISPNFWRADLETCWSWRADAWSS